MKKIIDYRVTPCGPSMSDILEGKKKFKSEFPIFTDYYRKVSQRNSIYHDAFAKVYHNKCAYCGVRWELLPSDCFEIDHYINRASFVNARQSGALDNLVWSCVSCNRGKRGITITGKYQKILNPDTKEIINAFYRDQDFYIRIQPKYAQDLFIQQFYFALHFNHEIRRLDYILMYLEGMHQNSQGSLREKIGDAIYLLARKRDCMVITS